MERQTFRAAHLVNNLLEFARPRKRAEVRTDLKAEILSLFAPNALLVISDGVEARVGTVTAGRGWLQFPMGGGIVAGSVPEKEYAETLDKAAGILRALD